MINLIEMSSNCKIIVCCHKDVFKVSTPPYFPIQVGKDLSIQDIGIMGDNTGDNISLKNRSYCELTGLYWAWRNLKDVDVIGLCHYRRYFDFHKQCLSILPYTKFESEQLDKLDFSVPDSLIRAVVKGKVVAPKVMNNVGSLYNEYCITHNSEDIRTLEEVVKEKSGLDYIRSFNKVMYLTHKPMCYNMFIMSWKDFDKYCSWLFAILEEVENRIDISNYNPVQQRVFGYMAERLFNVFVEAEHKKVIHKPLIFIMDEPNGSKFNYTIKSVLNDVSLFLSTLYLRFSK